MKYTFALLAFAFSVAIPVSAATDYLLVTPFTSTNKTSGCTSNTHGIQTGSEIVFPDEISSFTFGGTDPVSATTGGKVTLQNFVISKDFDDCSAPLITAFLASEPMPTVTIYASKTLNVVNGATLYTPYLTITLKNVIISQYTLTSNNEKPSEQISLAFSTASVTALKADGSGTTTLNYNGSLNQISH